LLQKATPLLGFKTKGQGQAVWEEEDGKGQKEKKGDTQSERGRVREWGREGRGKKKKQRDRTGKSSGGC